MGKIIGIDLGTTNSVMAVMVGGEPTVIPTAEGERTVRQLLQSTKIMSGSSDALRATRRSPTLKIPSSQLSALWDGSLMIRKFSVR